MELAQEHVHSTNSIQAETACVFQHFQETIKAYAQKHVDFMKFFRVQIVSALQAGQGTVMECAVLGFQSADRMNSSTVLSVSVLSVTQDKDRFVSVSAE